MSLRPGSAVPEGRTYRFFTGRRLGGSTHSPTLLYPFGHGLGYHQFIYSDIQVSVPSLRAPAIEADVAVSRRTPLSSPVLANVTLTVSCKFGAIESQRLSRIRTCPHSIILFASPPGAGTEGLPLRTVANFARVEPIPGKGSVLVNLPLTAFDLTIVDSSGQRK